MKEIITRDLGEMMRSSGVEVVKIEARIKDFDSFIKKVKNKKYSDPFNQCEDVCGIRLVCYFSSDLDQTCIIIDRRLTVLSSIDKEDNLGRDKFWYRSTRFVVQLRGDWTEAPAHRGLSGLKAEIQVRTILMHAWAQIEHILEYKKEEFVPAACSGLLAS
jgi:ppGpp synthetase/RelA/SpoT-type nucleotidyltranferase